MFAAAAPAVAQLRGPATAAAGSSIMIEVADNAGTLLVGTRPGHAQAYQVGASKRVEVQIPNAAPGTVIPIWVGRGLARSVHLVTIQ